MFTQLSPVEERVAGNLIRVINNLEFKSKPKSTASSRKRHQLKTIVTIGPIATTAFQKYELQFVFPQ